MNTKRTNNSTARDAGQVKTALVIYSKGKAELYRLCDLGLMLRRANAASAIKFVQEHSSAVAITAIYLVQSVYADIAEAEVQRFLLGCAQREEQPSNIKESEQRYWIQEYNKWGDNWRDSVGLDPRTDLRTALLEFKGQLAWGRKQDRKYRLVIRRDAVLAW